MKCHVTMSLSRSWFTQVAAILHKYDLPYASHGAAYETALERQDQSSSWCLLERTDEIITHHRWGYCMTYENWQYRTTEVFKGWQSRQNLYLHLYPWATQGNVEEELGIPMQPVQLVRQYHTPLPYSMQIAQWHNVWLLDRTGCDDPN